MDYRNFELEKKPPKKTRFKDIIIFEDDHTIVVNKPRSLSCLEERGKPDKDNLLKLARQIHPEIKICHRIDKETSGIVVFAKDPEAYRFINMQFQNRQVNKHYLALVKGARNFEEYPIDMPISVASSGKVRVNMSSGKESITMVETAEIFKNHCLLNCFPITGRTHQIRVHLSALGCPIVGDHLYGGEDFMLSAYKKKYNLSKYDEEQSVNRGLMLHARGIEFELPGKEESQHFISEPPKAFLSCLKVLRKYTSI